MRPIALIALMLPTAALAAEPVSDWSEYGVARTRLIAGESMEGAHRAAVQIALEPGWKTYWRAPGDAGIPPSFDWSGSENVAKVTVDWPRPTMFETYGYVTWGYDDGVVLPLTVVPEDAGEPVSLSMDIFYGVCSDLCAPVQGFATLALPAAPSVETTTLIAGAESKVPRDGALSGLSLHDVTVEGAGDERVILARVEGDFVPDVVLIDGPDDAVMGEVEVTQAEDGMTLRIPAMLYDDDALEGAEVSLTLLGPLRSAELTTTLGQPGS